MARPEFRKTKIVATIGPASDDPLTLKAMIAAGMNVARLNLSFGTLAEQRQRIERIRAAARELGAPVAIMVDTRGIEIRTARLHDGVAELAPGSAFTLYIDERIGDARGVSISYQGLGDEVTPGKPILLDDGAIELEVESVSGQGIRCRVVHGGTLHENKSVNLPETELSLSAVGPENREDVLCELGFAADNDVEYVAASFVQSADDIHKMREILKEQGADCAIIAKIENQAGVAHLEAIVAAADGTMVARGDLGVELPLAEVPRTQKRIIRTTVGNGKPVITATQMLASMEFNPKPTRAEASDVANAILDGTSAVMLSGETAMGRYPVAAVETMATLAIRAEAALPEYGYLQKILLPPSNVVTEAVSQAAVDMARQLNAAAIFSLTSTGFTARRISKHRPDCVILAITASEQVAHRLAMNWGVIPLCYQADWRDDAKIDFALDKAESLGFVRAGDIVIVTAGYGEKAGGTDRIRVITLGADRTSG
jgi:pyruvate kinase